MNGALTLDREELLQRFYARDHANDGAFVVGVVTTGIYCLPSCRARSPKPENVRFFSSEDEARSAGLRPCLRCLPDHFYRRFDPDRERLRALAARLRRDPSTPAEASELGASLGVGATKLNALFRRHYHLTPAAFLVRARVQRAMENLAERRSSVLDAAEESGFESASAFHENFRALTGMTPAAYREIGEPGFSVALPQDASVAELCAFFGRDEQGRTERVRGGELAKAAVLDGAPVRIELAVAGPGVNVRLDTSRPLSRQTWFRAHAFVARWLGMESDAPGFERRAGRSQDIARLVRGRAGLRIPRVAEVFEGLVWVVVGAQVNVAFASACRSALIELAGTPCGQGFVAHPTPEQVARLDYADLERRKFSRRKAEYLIDASRAIAAGELDLEGLRQEPATVVQETLAAVRGLGPWSVQYLALRAYGFEDCVPAGDVALAEALRRFFALEQRPVPAEVERLMEPFAPHRSLATYHLWKTLSS